MLLQCAASCFGAALSAARCSRTCKIPFCFFTLLALHHLSDTDSDSRGGEGQSPRESDSEPQESRSVLDNIHPMVRPATFSMKTSERPNKFCDIFYRESNNVAHGLAVRKAAVVQATWDRLPVIVFFKSVQNSTKDSKWAQDSVKSFYCRMYIHLVFTQQYDYEYQSNQSASLHYAYSDLGNC